MVKYILCDCKCEVKRTTCNSTRKYNNETCQCEYKNYRKYRKIIVGILAHVFVRTASILKVLLILQWFDVMKLYLLWIFYQQKRKIL